jgi:hypothetical protein
MKERKQTSDFSIDRIINIMPLSKVMRGIKLGVILSVAVLLVTACADNNSPAAAELPTITVKPSETPQPTATLTPTATEDPFKGLGVCRTWQEAVNCPITEKDFRRISDYVKASFIFPPQALKVSYRELAPSDNTGSVWISPIPRGEWGVKNEERAAILKNEGKKHIMDSSLSPIGKPYFFNLKTNPPMVNRNMVVAVYPVNNTDGSLGTYTILTVPLILINPNTGIEWADMGKEQTIMKLVACFEKVDYCAPATSYGKIPISLYGEGLQGTFVDEMFRDIIDPKGKRKELFDEWASTAIVPKALEEMPLDSAVVYVYD